MLVLDGKVVIGGSFNYTGEANQYNDENLFIIRDTAIASHFQAEVERVFEDDALSADSTLELAASRGGMKDRLGVVTSGLPSLHAMVRGDSPRNSCVSRVGGTEAVGQVRLGVVQAFGKASVRQW